MEPTIKVAIRLSKLAKEMHESAYSMSLLGGAEVISHASELDGAAFMVENWADKLEREFIKNES